MIDQIRSGENLLALILHAGYEREGLSFVTPPEALLQVGHMTHPAGHRIPPHIHNPHPRHTTGTQEVIFIKSGRVRVDFYTQEQRYLESREVGAGDWLILLSGGHGFETIEPTTMIEVKNGPYAGAADKTRLETAERA
jgi:mannose-6-phosphate isomerase-like protein (cupin superfamily)